MLHDRRVDFLLCGTQKGGTAALYSYLRHHPDICMADRKEVHFFDDEAMFADGKPDYSRYHAFFSPTHAGQVTGEATPIYMYWHDAPRRIREYNPGIKLVVLLRNPIERAYSHWNMERSRNAEDLPFLDAIQRESERCRAALPLQHRVYSYIDRGFYLEQLRRLRRYFRPEQILLLPSEQLRDRPDVALRSTSDFLGIAPFRNVERRSVHAREYPSPMSDAERGFLRGVFEHEIRGIEKETGWDCRHWLEGSGGA